MAVILVGMEPTGQTGEGRKDIRTAENIKETEDIREAEDIKEAEDRKEAENRKKEKRNHVTESAGKDDAEGQGSAGKGDTAGKDDTEGEGAGVQAACGADNAEIQYARPHGESLCHGRNHLCDWTAHFKLCHKQYGAG